MEYWEKCISKDLERAVKQAVKERNRKESYRNKCKKFKAEIKEIQEFYHPKKFRKHDVHKDWKEDWKGFVECTYPWSGSSILETIVYRLEVLRTDLKYFCHHTEGEKMIKEMDEAIAIGRKILDFDYENNAYEFLRNHTTNYALVYKKLTPNPKDMRDGELLTKIEMPRDDEFNFKKVIDKTYISPLDKYLKDNNLKEYKDVNVGYIGEWDIPENHDVWMKMLKEAKKQRNVDKRNFYHILCNKLESWGD